MIKKHFKILIGNTYFTLTKYFQKNNSFIVYFHGVEEKIIDNDIQLLQIEFQKFKKIINFLTKNFEVISLDDLINNIKHTSSRKQIAITFDDGYLNNYEIAYDYLKKENIPFTIYLISSFISSNKRLPTFLTRLIIKYTSKSKYFSKIYNKEISLENKKDKTNYLSCLIYDLKNKPINFVKILMNEIQSLISQKDLIDLLDIYKSESFMNWSQIKKMRDICTFGSHTENHFTFNKMQNAESIKNEILNSFQTIKNEIGYCNHLALPNGHFNDKILSYNFDISSIATTKQSILNLENIFLLPRFGIDNFNPIQKLKYDLSAETINVKLFSK